MALSGAQPPYASAAVGQGGRVSPFWQPWFERIVAAVTAMERLASVALTTQEASIAATDVGASLPAAGLYRVSYYARITRAATTSSSLTVTLSWTDGGVACSQAGAAMTGNTTATVQSDSVVVSVDAATAIQYATTYGTVGATTMQYALSLYLEPLP